MPFSFGRVSNRHLLHLRWLMWVSPNYIYIVILCSMNYDIIFSYVSWSILQTTTTTKKSSDLIGSLHLFSILFLYSGLVLFSPDISLAYSSGLFWLNQSTTHLVKFTHITTYSWTLFIQTQVSLFSFGTMDI